ncbi:conserved hypothetical protein, membrane [Candidatus Magnetobacterium bavaricum]|uniref:Uncharacterized protein n=1 Tax=Candidatus Magnetobacterium bavaricum TaxID=29290 RepID=A0A0F3GW89_9BACT|nr:conserved hypothetical protein, membrane [Candidatus Magnetobacterium bavaricum]
MLLLLFLPLINITNDTTWISFMIIIIACCIYLAMIDAKREDLKVKNLNFQEFLTFLESVFIISKEEISKFKARAFFQDILLVSLISFCSNIVMLIYNYKKVNIADYITELCLYLFLILLVFVVNILFQENKKIKTLEVKLPDSLFKSFTSLVKSFTRYISISLNYNHRIHVKINLGHDNLKEIDILKLIAQNVLIQFNEFSRFRVRIPFPDIPWMFFKIIFIFALLTIIYRYPAITDTSPYKDYQESVTCKIVKYFPSQEETWSDNKSESEKKQFHEKCSYKKDNIEKIQTITIYIDMKIETTFHAFVNISKDIPIFGALINNFEIFTKRINYSFIASFLVLWYLIGFPFRIFFGIRTFGTIRKNISDLNDSINAQVLRENSTEASIGKNTIVNSLLHLLVKISGRQSKSYPMADAREIEKQLIYILDEIDKIPKLIRRPQFIFIFDELDKIEPQNINEAEDKQIPGGSESITFSSQESIQRQHVILKMLSNLKYFLTTAKAKFIFIAGREMYDTSLADVSDRNYFMGSIFHDVINVNSFLTDSSNIKSHDITNMTEQYVCRYLIPDSFTKGQPEDYSLKTYRNYLEKEIYVNDDTVITKLKIEKLIITVHNFIIYLTYRSNGSPKKLTRYFEKHVVQPDEKELQGSKNLYVGRNSKNLYLEFGYYDQYTLGLVTYIATPIILSIKRTLKDFSDKILVSTAFILDHIYKFHRYAFSWRNLEVTPEIILDISKTPELRELIDRTMQFLAKNNIQEMSGGPYNFRFINKIADEISFLSKISKREAAAFNFTLEELRSLKKHYKDHLKRLESKYGSSFKSNKDNEHIHSISFVHMVLGELYFYDEEYHEAIIELMESIQQLRVIKIEEMDISAFYTYIKAMMLLGLVYEKGRSFTSAYTTYAKITSIIIKYRQYLNSLFTPPALLLEDIRQIYPPFLAKLQIIEKNSLNGITDSDIKQIDDEIAYIQGSNASEKFLVESESLCKIGDILYYKNGLIPKNDSTTINLKNTSYCIKHNFCSDNSPLNSIANNSTISMESAKKLRYPCRACEYYLRSLENLCKNNFGIQIRDKNPKEILTSMLNTIVDGDEDYVQKKAVVAKAIGNVLSNIGDTFLSCVKHKTPIKNLGLIELLQCIEKDDLKNNVKKLEDFIKDDGNQNKLCEVLTFYCASALFFITARMHKEYSFQFTKILCLIQECMDFSVICKSFRDRLIDLIGKILIKRITQGIYRSYENVHRLEIEKYKKLIDEQDVNKSYSSLSLSGDIREVIIRYTEIKIKCKCEDITLKDNFISPYTTIYTMRNRVIGLKLKADINENLFIDLADMETMSNKYPNYKLVGNLYDPFQKNRKKKLFRRLISIVSTNSGKINATFGQNIQPKLVIEFLITDSIFCLREIIKMCKTYGFSYDINHSYIASAYLKLAIWCDYYCAYRDCYSKDIESTLSNLIGDGEMTSINPYHQYEMARYHCLCAIETHSERKAYKNIIEKMYYLNDDFNDSLYHFSAAVERFRINSGQVEEMITITRERATDDGLYDPKTYYP